MWRWNITNKRILISDGNYKNALAILRALKNKYDVDVITPHSKLLTLSYYSKYSKKTYKLSFEDEKRHIMLLIDLIKKNKYDVFIPVGLKNYVAASINYEKITRYTHALIPRWDQMKIAYNKDLTMKFARKIGVPIPQTTEINSTTLSLIEKYPIVIKSSDESGNFVKYCRNKSELKRNYEYLKKISKTKIIAQEYITGFGTGFYGVCKKGKIYAHFMHKRIKEFPITGGPSAVAESYFDDKLLNYGKKICEHLKWDGPLMAEFKYSPTKKDYYLIEINPKLWGSLDLTIAAGVNIPEIIIELALDREPRPVTTFKKVKFKWLFPDEFKVLISGGESIKEFLRIDKNTHTNINLEDSLPTLFQIIMGLWEGFLVGVNEKYRYPHGRI